MSNGIEIYQSTNHQIEISVQFVEDTVWLSQAQIATLFGKGRTTITEHIKNVFDEGELQKELVCRDFRQTTPHGAMQGKTQKNLIKYYNLDVVISVGYRVKSPQGTQFRLWATQRLKDYLVKGYALNQARLQEKESQFIALKQSVKLLGNIANKVQLNEEEASGLLKVIAKYAYALDLLDQYDHQQLKIPKTATNEVITLSYEEAIEEIILWRKTYQAGALFGNEKDQSFKSSLATIYQTFDGIDLYPSTEEKAANLLYLVVKNHSFSDGNKRIAAGIYIYFLAKNKLLYKDDGIKIIDDNALVAITIMIAESNPNDKDTMVKLVVNLMTIK